MDVDKAARGQKIMQDGVRIRRFLIDDVLWQLKQEGHAAQAFAFISLGVNILLKQGDLEELKLQLDVAQHQLRVSLQEKEKQNGK